MADYSLSPLGFDFIRKQEGFRAKPYWDVRQWSTGFGTRASGPDDVVDRAEAERRLAGEAGKVSAHLSRNVRVPMSQGQHDALVSFGYNLGTDDIDKLMPDINAGNWGRVGERMLSFNRAGGQVHPVLVARRKAEADMLGGGAGDMPAKPSYLAQALNMAGVVPGAGPAGMLPAVMAAPAGSGGGMAGPGGTPIGGAPVAGGPVPLTAPNMRYSKLADALLASAAGAKPRGWGELVNAAGDLALGYTLGNRADEEQKAYKGKLAEALLGASDNDAMAKTLMATGDDDLVKQGVALKVAQQKPQNQIGRFRATKQGIFDSVTGQIVPGTEQAENPESAEHGTTPVAYIDKDGNLRYTQLSKAGGRKDVELPEGARWAPGYDIRDTGTALTGIDKKTGAVGPVVPKDITGKEAQEEVGKLSGQAQAALPAARTAIDSAFKTINELRTHPGLDVGTGASNVFDPRSWIPGTNSYDFQAKNRQAQGQSFMAARDALKGAGQVTDFEGQKGEQAIANLDAAQSREQYLAALDTLEKMMRASYDDLERKAGMASGASTSPPAQTTPKFDMNAAKQKYGLE